MTELEKRILHVFDEYVFGFMRSDINAAIRGNANYLAALGLVTYTEILGGLRTGRLGIKGTSQQNFNAFIPYLGNDYLHLKSQGFDIYEFVRCGLIHNYFIKGDSTIWMDATGPGIIGSSKGRTFFLVKEYANDLFKGAADFRDQILEGKDPTLASNFDQGMKNIELWK